MISARFGLRIAVGRTWEGTLGIDVQPQMSVEQPRNTRDRPLKAPMNDHICQTVVGRGQEARVAIR